MGNKKPIPEKMNKPKPIGIHKPEIEDFHSKLMIVTGGKDPNQIINALIIQIM